MVDVDDSQAKDLVASLRQEASAAARQWATWLGVGSGGGVIALLSFIANLPDPDRALSLLSPALASFILAIIFAAPSILILAAELQSASIHFAAAHNRDSMRRAVAKMPLAIASPPSLADDMNRERNHLSGRADREHEEAQSAWTVRMRWRYLRRLCMALSAIGFVCGAGYPMLLVAQHIPLVVANNKPSHH